MAPNSSVPSTDPTADTDFPDGWIRYRILPESDQFPGSKVARMRRAIKALGRAYGVRVEGFHPPPAEDAAAANVAKPQASAAEPIDPCTLGDALL